MISANEAKLLSGASDCGLEEYMEEISDEIEEAAKSDTSMEYTYNLEYAMPEGLTEEICKTLRKKGFTVKMVKVKCSSSDEYGDSGHVWDEDAIYINWRMA